MKATWSVVILFEDAQTREKAVKFCDQLVERFWANCEFRLTWMEFSALDDSNAVHLPGGEIIGYRSASN